MGSPATPAPAAEFLAVFLEYADSGAAMPFARFMDLALYDPRVGYYRRPGTRVGYGPGTDFYTAASSRPFFGELVAAACATLLGGLDPAGATFVEIGAEPGAPGVLEGVAHPFAGVRTLRSPAPA